MSWDMVPSQPTLLTPGLIVHLVSFVRGKVTKVNHLERIGSMSSVVQAELYDHFREGNVIEKTMDIRTDAGWLHMMNEDEEVLWAEYEEVVKLMETMFEVADEGEEGKLEDLFV